MIQSVPKTYINQTITERKLANESQIHRVPLVRFDNKKGILFIKRKIDHKNHLLSRALIRSVKFYLTSHNDLRCYFLFREMNGMTLQILFKLFKEFQIPSITKNIRIIWFVDYQNKEMLEAGIDFADMFDLNINILPYDTK